MWVILCQIQLVPLHCSYFYSGSVGLTGCEWFYASPLCLFSLFSHPLWLCWPDSMWVKVQLCPFSVFSVFSLLLLWFCWLDRVWVILCQIQLVPFHCSYFYSGSIGLAGCEWFYARSTFSLVSYPLWFCWLDSMWVIHAKSSCAPSHCFHFYSDSVGLTGCEWFHARSSWSLLTVLNFHTGFVGLIVCKWFMPGPAVPLLTVLTSTLVVLSWQYVSDSCQVQLCPFSLFSLLALWSCWLDSGWVIPFQVQLCLLSQAE